MGGEELENPGEGLSGGSHREGGGGLLLLSYGWHTCVILGLCC